MPYSNVQRIANTHEENLQVTSLEDLTKYLKSNSLITNRNEEHDCQCQSNEDASKFFLSTKAKEEQEIYTASKFTPWPSRSMPLFYKLLKTFKNMHRHALK
jgi:hypothetical protein